MSGITPRRNPWPSARFQEFPGVPLGQSGTPFWRSPSRQQTNNNKAADSGKESAATSIAVAGMPPQRPNRAPSRKTSAGDSRSDRASSSCLRGQIRPEDGAYIPALRRRDQPGRCSSFLPATPAEPRRGTGRRAARSAVGDNCSPPCRRIAHLPWAKHPPFQRLYPVRAAFNVFNSLGNLLSLRRFPQPGRHQGFWDSSGTGWEKHQSACL